jgi:hypothetical protein
MVQTAHHPPDHSEFRVSYAQQRYFAATAIAIMAAIILRAAQLPSPWPAAIAVYVYGLVAWPAVRDEMLPNLRPGMYTAICLAAALLVIVYENLGAAAGW